MPQDRHGPDHDSGGQRRVGRRPRLTPTQVVDAAVELADDRGLDALSMPKLAKHLGIGTMTVYGYVENKQDLLDKMAARIFEYLTFSGDKGWTQGLTDFFVDFRQAALAHPTLAALLATGRVTIPAVFDVLETFLRTAVDSGVSIEESVSLFYAALTYTIGFVLWEIPRTRLQTEAAYADQWTELIAELDPAEYPLVTGAGATRLPTVASTPQFQAGLDRIVAG